MYLVGAQHPHKIDAQRLLEKSISENERLVTDAEVLQEILHRYVAIDKKEAIIPALQAVLDLVDEVFPIERRDVERAKDILLATQRLSARDAVHIATMERRQVTKIMTSDSGFDDYPGIKRLSAP
jgi:uncharacterized protein